MNQLTDVVKKILIINILFFVGTQFMGEPAPEAYGALLAGQGDFVDWRRLVLAMFYPTSEYFRPFQIVTHLFMHASVGHIFFNMFGLYMFGPPLEVYYGARKFFILYFVAGFGALILHFGVKYREIQQAGAAATMMENVPTLGASGAIFGLLAAYGTVFPNNIIQLLFPPIALRAKYFVIIYAGIELFLGIGSFNTGIAHFAHLGGALFGFLLIMYWQRFGNDFRRFN